MIHSSEAARVAFGTEEWITAGRARDKGRPCVGIERVFD